MPEKKKCFVISPIGKPKLKTNKEANSVFEYVISKAVVPLNYTAIRSDHIAKSGHITIQIIEHLKNDELVIADVRKPNPNVFYELAIRHVTKKPYILLKKPRGKLPFDIADCRAIGLDITDPESVENAKKGIEEQINSMEEETTNPLSLALDNLFLRESLHPMENQIGEIFRIVSVMSASSALGMTDKEIEHQLKTATRISSDASKQACKLRAIAEAIKNNGKLSAELGEIKTMEEIAQQLFSYYRDLTFWNRARYREAQRNQMVGQANQKTSDAKT